METDKPKQVSTMMEEPSYDADTKTLNITFKKGGVYTYPNFEEEHFKAFHEADSWGKFFHSHKDLFVNGKRRVLEAEPSLS